MASVDIKKAKHNLAGFLLIMILFAISVLGCNHLIKRIETTRDSTIYEMKERDFDVIWDYISSISDIAYDEGESLAENIEDTINNTPNKETLNKLLLQRDPKTMDTIEDILNNCVDDFDWNSLIYNNRNTIAITLGYDNILVDNFHDTNKSKNDVLKSLSDYVKIAYNKKLTKNAIESIHSCAVDQPICMEIYNFIDESVDHQKISNFTYDTCKEVYMKEGIAGLTNYQLICPTYITKYGDIFGNRDIKNGAVSTTNKFIVLITINIYDYIKQLGPKFDSVDVYNTIIERYSELISVGYFISILVCGVFLAMAIYFVHEIVEKDDTIDYNTKANKKRIFNN